MSFKQKNFKVLMTTLVLILLNTLSISSNTIIVPSDNKELKVFKPSTVELVQTTQNITLTLNGKRVSLPKFENKVSHNNWAYNTRSIHNDSIAVSQNREEMVSLANKLGINIRSAKHIALYREAASWLGTKYRWAGNTRKGIDCSGLTNVILNRVFNKEIDRISSSIAANNVSKILEKNELEPGDLVFFSTMRKKRITHVGVYLGDGHFIHASRRGVVVSSLDDGYYARTLTKAGRI